METPVPYYKSVNAAMREGKDDDFAPHKPFVHYLDQQLRALPEFDGSVYRAIGVPWKQKQDTVCWHAFSSSASKVPAPLCTFFYHLAKRSHCCG
jgi:hypothetical protein